MKKASILLLLFLLFLPVTGSAQSSQPVGPRFSCDYSDADVRTVLRVLAEVAKRNVIIADDVKGKVTLKLQNVSYDEAFDVILRNNDLAKIEDDNILRIVTMKRRAEEQERAAKERIEYQREKAAREKSEEEFVTETVYINYADADEVVRMIKGETSSQAKGAMDSSGKTAVLTERTQGLLSANGVITLVKWNSALIIKDTKQNVASIVKLIKEHDIPPQQVQIEARIVQANDSFSKDLGVQWAATYNTTINGKRSTTTASVDPSQGTATAGAGTMEIFIGSIGDSFRLNATLTALENEGRGKVISNPKVMALDNRPARITQGQQIPYLNTTSQNGATVEFKDAVLELEVTPHVVKDGNIRLTIKAKKDRADLATYPTNPPIDKREATTEVFVRDGETAVIGGIYEISQDKGVTGVPFLRKIPLLGWLFKNETENDTKTELLIFVTPTILKNLYTEKRG
jgi:type IV pilus assembly protein PilQ